ncbi:MAG: ATP synthase F1 subunit gamma [Blastocatellia bacterium]|nr:ATP synthase F1 subunit gamma [Blastocatellia bacterium]
MANLQDLRRRVRAVKNMRQITKAMKMVAAARLRRAQERVTAARPYTAKFMQILGNAARRAPEYKDPLLVGHERGENRAEKVLLVLVTADKGLCGGFNTNLIKAASDFLRRNSGSDVEMVVVGRKGYDFFRRRNVKIRREHLGITGTGRVRAEDASQIAQELVADFLSSENEVDRVYLLYGEFKSAIQQKPVVEQLLPIKNLDEAEKASADSLVDYLYEQPAETIFGELLPKLIENQVYHALLESVASELGARMAAMDSATKNAGEVIDKLTLTMNRVRQAKITREIIEVVSGAEAL